MAVVAALGGLDMAEEDILVVLLQLARIAELAEVEEGYIVVAV